MSGFAQIGTIKRIGITKQVTEKFSKRDLVLEVADGDYPQTVAFEMHQDRTDIINPFKVGDKVTVSFNLRGREWTSPQGEVKVFNTLVAWRIAPVAQDDQPAAPAAQVVNAVTVSQGGEDLPF